MYKLIEINAKKKVSNCVHAKGNLISVDIDKDPTLNRERLREPLSY